MSNKVTLIKSSIIATALLAAIPAFAAKEQGPGACQGNCPTTGGSPINNTNTATGGTGYGTGIGIGLGGQGGAGGNGGQGGQGGTSSAIGQGGMGGAGFGGAGGSVAGSGNSRNENRNDNLNVNSAKQGQSQGQGQAQGQSQRNSSRNDNRSNATGGSSTSYGSVATTAQALTVEGDNVTYQAARIPVATAYAPNIAPTAVCMGSSSAGGQGPSFGFSVGTSWTDSNCILLEQVRAVASILGDKETAAEMMMAIPAYAEARERLGSKRLSQSPAVPEQAPVKVVKAPEYTDPIVRARLNLPPLK